MEKILEVLGSIGFDWRVALANLVNFSLVLFLLHVLVFKKIAQVLRDRRALVERGIEDAQKAATALESAREQERAVLKEASLQAQEVMAQAQVRGEDIVAEARVRAEVVAREEVQKAQQEAARLVQGAHGEAEAIAITLVLEGVQKVLSKKMTQEVDESYIRESLLEGAKTV